MTNNLWIDDVRTPPDGWVWCKTSEEALTFIKNTPAREVGIVSFDHDLGGDDTTRPIVLWMCEHEWWPAEVRVHSANPVGVGWLEGMVNRYGPYRKGGN